MSEQLDRVLQHAFQALAADPSGALARGQREAIWAALGPRDDHGRARRAQLAIAAVERVLPLWHGDDLASRLLRRAREVLDDTADRKRAAQERGRAWTTLDDLANQRDDASVVVGYAAAQALGAALFDEDFDPGAIHLGRTDADVDPETHDASYLASIAVAGAPPWDASGSVERRREFWNWWLTHAVPTVTTRDRRP